MFLLCCWPVLCYLSHDIDFTFAYGGILRSCFAQTETDLLFYVGTQQQLLGMVTRQPLMHLVQDLYGHCAVFENAGHPFNKHEALAWWPMDKVPFAISAPCTSSM